MPASILKCKLVDVGEYNHTAIIPPSGKTQTAMDFRVSKSIMDDRLSFEVGGDFNLNQDQSGSNTGKNYRGDFAIIYDLTGKGDKQLKLFNNQTFDIIIRNQKHGYLVNLHSRICQ
ncbi:MAG: translocation/assembly module TamB domain-containing protein [Flammeovirgaceae bacterium]|nr:translocation/assembly module TamB domain-containing protein [Flammeovirgaceae bacterium]